MATPKQVKVDFRQAGRVQREQFERDNKFIREEWYVVEYWPASEDDLSGWVSSKVKICSVYFDSPQGAEDFIASFDPAPGAEFQIRRRVLRESVEHRWWPF